MQSLLFVRARSMRLVAVVAMLATVSSCSSETSRELIGYVPPSAKSVASVTASEVVGNSTQPFTFRATDNELLVVFFGYTNCPDICPATLANLKNTKAKLGELASRVDVAMVTVDPERDTQDIMPKYLSSFLDRFHAVIPATSRELETAKDAFQVKSSVTKTADGRVEVTHTGTSYVVDDTGTVIVEWPFGIDVPSMTNDLKILLTKKESNT